MVCRPGLVRGLYGIPHCSRQPGFPTKPSLANATQTPRGPQVTRPWSSSAATQDRTHTAQVPCPQAGQPGGPSPSQVGRAVNTQPCMKHPRALLHSVCCHPEPAASQEHVPVPAALETTSDTIRTASTSYELPHHGLLSPHEAPSSSKAPGWSSDHPRGRRERDRAVLSAPHRGPCKLLYLPRCIKSKTCARGAILASAGGVPWEAAPRLCQEYQLQTATRSHQLRDASLFQRSDRQRCARSELMT